MNLARILYPVQVLGPGNRVGLWLCGCHRACPGCSNPELWVPKAEYDISVDHVVNLIQRINQSHVIDGFTISGGEPFLQVKELSQLISCLKQISSDILIYTGFQIEELKRMNDTSVSEVLNMAAVIIDGAYVEELNDNSVLRGSSNQGIHVINPNFYELYGRYLNSTHNQIQNFSTINGIVSVGIHRKTFRRDI